MSNPVIDFVHLVQSTDADPASDHTEQYGRAVASLMAAANDPDTLDRYGRILVNAESWVAQQGNENRYAAPLRTLLELLERVGPNDVRSEDADVSALASMVRGKAHADRVLREMVHGPKAPREIQGQLGLDPPQLHRVLSWAVAAGLVERAQLGREVVYSLTRLGEVALRGTDEPTWVPTAALLATLATEARIRRIPADDVCRTAAQLSGLPLAAAERVLLALEGALRPSPSSALAAALGSAYSSREVVLEAENASGLCAASLVSRALERAGVGAEVVRWRQSSGWDAPQDRRHRALAAPLISIGKPTQGTLGREIVSAFGELLRVDNESLHLRMSARASGTSWKADGQADYGVVARFYSPATGTSYFVIAGVGSEGETAAARTFYERIEGLLHERPDDSFAAVVRKRGDSDEVIVHSVRNLVVADPYQAVHSGFLVDKSELVVRSSARPGRPAGVLESLAHASFREKGDPMEASVHPGPAEVTTGGRFAGDGGNAFVSEHGDGRVHSTLEQGERLAASEPASRDAVGEPEFKMDNGRAADSEC